MTKNKLKEKLNPSLHYLVDWSYSDVYKEISKNVYKAMINNFTTEKIDICCSWFCGTDYDLFNKMGFDCHYYDMDEVVCDANKNLTQNVYNVDIIFDNVRLRDAVIVNKYCENTFPIGRVFKGNFILVGSDNPHLSNVNKITSTEMLIEQNRLTTIYEQTTFFNKHNFYLVAGCNI
tara:strand:+ start:361 stop:888 length:528 start_codon:yes stop_codon:yes gene_type:complete